MARLTLDQSTSPFRLMDTLPEIYQRRDGLIEHITGSVDELLAPVWLSLDNFEQHLDPAIAPLDFVEMLAGWLGLPFDHNWNGAQARRLVASAGEIFQWRGTVRGLRALIQAYCEDDPDEPIGLDIVDSGGSIVDLDGDAEAPGDERPSVRIAIEIPRSANVEPSRLTELIAEYVPVHVAVNVEVTRGGD